MEHSREVTPPPGYTTTPPTEEGWYRVWSDDFLGFYRVTEVWRSRSWGETSGELCVNGPWRVDNLDGWFWGPKVEF